MELEDMYFKFSSKGTRLTIRKDGKAHEKMWPGLTERPTCGWKTPIRGRY